MNHGELLLGETVRSVDERFRISLPSKLVERLTGDDGACVLAKERRGCLSLWSPEAWQETHDAGLRVVRERFAAGRMQDRLIELQTLGRLLSTRHSNVRLAGRSRLVIPEGFRDFLQVEAGGEVVVVGAAVSVEIWRPDAWRRYLERRMPRFRKLFDALAG